VLCGPWAGSKGEVVAIDKQKGTLVVERDGAAEAEPLTLEPGACGRIMPRLAGGS